MVVQEQFIKKLRSAFNLNIYEAKIWTALLSKGVATAGELSEISNVPRSRSYDVLESLEKRGFVVMKLGKPIKYIAVQPSETLKREKKAFLEKANEQISSLSEVETSPLFKELDLLFKNGINHIDPTLISGAFKGRKNLYEHMNSMLEKAKKSVVIMTSAQGLTRKADSFSSILKRLAQKGVSIKIAAPLTKENEKQVAELKKFSEVKNIDKIKGRFILVDSKEILFMINDDKEVHETYDIGIWATSPLFVNALESFFNATFQE
ncbi:TrmB family transcriptional regulator [Candidatus Woesearchaeota archaeon]|nr:TrmB family transcriptional regulator [Candidatus Woesearchaeota archaeon]